MRSENQFSRHYSDLVNSLARNPIARAFRDISGDPNITSSRFFFLRIVRIFRLFYETEAYAELRETSKGDLQFGDRVGVRWEWKSLRRRGTLGNPR